MVVGSAKFVGHILLFFIAAFQITPSLTHEHSDCTSHCTSLYLNKVVLKQSLYWSCERGCRFFNISLAIRPNNPAHSRLVCRSDCHAAYGNFNNQAKACIDGCQYGRQRVSTKVAGDEPIVEFMYPMLQVHRVYNDLFNTMWKQLHLKWTYFVREGNGAVLVMKSDPQTIITYQEIHYSNRNDKTEMNPLSNLQVDLSATPDLKNSQVRSLDHQYTQKDPQSYYSDWLRCLSNRTRMPHVIIVLIATVCGVIMIWLCFTATTNTPNKQKLSINGDLQYMKDMGLEELMASDSPHDRIHANQKIPFKINVQKI